MLLATAQPEKLNKALQTSKGKTRHLLWRQSGFHIDQPAYGQSHAFFIVVCLRDILADKEYSPSMAHRFKLKGLTAPNVSKTRRCQVNNGCHLKHVWMCLFPSGP